MSRKVVEDVLLSLFNGTVPILGVTFYLTRPRRGELEKTQAHFNDIDNRLKDIDARTKDITVQLERMENRFQSAIRFSEECAILTAVEDYRDCILAVCFVSCIAYLLVKLRWHLIAGTGATSLSATNDPLANDWVSVAGLGREVLMQTTKTKSWSNPTFEVYGDRMVEEEAMRLDVEHQMASWR